MKNKYSQLIFSKSGNLFLLAAFLLGIGLFPNPLEAARVDKAANQANYLPGDTVTWNLVVQPGDATTSQAYTNDFTTLPAWTNQATGWGSWMITGGALHYGNGADPTMSSFPQFINTAGPMVGDAEYLYDTMIPPLSLSPDEDSVLIFRNISCQTYFMIRLDHYQNTDTCNANTSSALFLTRLPPRERPAAKPHSRPWPATPPSPACRKALGTRSGCGFAAITFTRKPGPGEPRNRPDGC